MLEQFLIFHRGGFVLFQLHPGAALEGDPVGRLVAEQLVEERAAAADFTVGPYSLKWRLDNQRDVVYVVVTRTVLHITYTDKLLDRSTKEFAKLLDNNQRNVESTYDYAEAFLKTLRKAEAADEGPSRPAVKPEEATTTTTTTTAEPAAAPRPEPVAADSEQETEAGEGSGDSDAPLTAEEIRKRVLARGGGGKGKSSKSKAKPTPPPAKTKTARTWDTDTNSKVTEKKSASLNKSKGNEAELAQLHAEKGSERVRAYNMDLEVSSEDEDGDDASADATAAASQPKRGFFGNLIRGLTGRTLDEADVEPVLAQLQDHLVQKNVASDVAKQLCLSVRSSLLGKHLGSLSSVSSLVTEALRVALTKILTPKRTIDILRDVEVANNSEGRPYTVVFVGINGVGKSTNLAKVASWFIYNEKRVLIAACDTFRSGAVEQLAVHCRALDVPLFQQGYGHDAASIAQQAVRQAAKDGQQVVLIDTAGRMQDNERLMQALAKLVAVNRPDLILFVGEALAGNDSVDQLTKFNQALVDFGAGGSVAPRTVDGVILSKFDTVDDQVGTAVSLVYSSGLPIVFLGVGQHYADLKKLNVQAVVKALLK